MKGKTVKKKITDFLDNLEANHGVPVAVFCFIWGVFAFFGLGGWIAWHLFGAIWSGAAYLPDFMLYPVRGVLIITTIASLFGFAAWLDEK